MSQEQSSKDTSNENTVVNNNTTVSNEAPIWRIPLGGVNFFSCPIDEVVKLSNDTATVYRLIHFTESYGKRVITVAYTYDKVTGLTQYGACLWNAETRDVNDNTKKTLWTKYYRQTSNATALQRLQKHPVTVVLDPTLKYEKRMKHLRSYIGEFGVRSHYSDVVSDSVSDHIFINKDLLTCFKQTLDHVRGCHKKNLKAKMKNDSYSSETNLHTFVVNLEVGKDIFL